MAALPQLSTRPAWQTDVLQDEWVDVDPEDDAEKDDQNQTHGTGSISLTVALPTHIHTLTDHESGDEQCSQAAIGTLLIREDIPNSQLLPKPGGQKKNLIRDIFSLTPLERIFEPPSPPPAAAVNSLQNAAPVVKLDPRSIHAADNATIGGSTAQFTFAIPRSSSLPSKQVQFSSAKGIQRNINSPSSVRGPAPTPDAPLRLFQFHYDTYTRDHLSAMVDSIAINTTSGNTTTSSPASFAPQPTEACEPINSFSHLRSTKRVKLSPPTDYDEEETGGGVTIMRPRYNARDYVGESRSLMQQIKDTDDFSTVSTVGTTEQPSGHLNPNSKDNPHGSAPKRADHTQPFSSNLERNGQHARPGSSTTMKAPSAVLAYRQQAAALMAQIRSDMKGQKRSFCGDTDVPALIEDTGKTPVELPQAPAGHAWTAGNRRTAGKPPEQSVIPVSSNHRADFNKLSLRKHSPRKHTNGGGSGRRISAPDQTERSLSATLSQMSIRRNHQSVEPSPKLPVNPVDNAAALAERNPVLASLAPSARTQPSYPSLLHANTNDDLNRFVSSSTASGTTLTAGSAPSFVKHAGPARIRTIAPGDVPALPDRLGDMIFDKSMGRWIKSTVHPNANQELPTDDGSEDPFGDIESLRDESRGREAIPPQHNDREKDMTSPHEQSDIEDQEELELTSFSTDESAQSCASTVTGAEAGNDDGQASSADSEETDSGSEGEGEPTPDIELHQRECGTEGRHDPDPPPTGIPEGDGQFAPPSCFPGAALAKSDSTGMTPPIKSVLKSTSVTPSSALKDPRRSRYQTPVQKLGQRRSVSFSDGKREGPIRGLNGSTNASTDRESDRVQNSIIEVASAAGSATRSNFVPSVRSRRIADMMGALIDTDPDGNSASSSRSSSPYDSQPDQPLPVPSASLEGDMLDNVKGKRNCQLPNTSHFPESPQGPSLNRANATFLTECSFGVAHDRLVEVITDVQPFEPHWENLPAIDLSRKKLESVARLKEFLPRLDALNLNTNQVAWLSGVPGTVRTLSISSNRLTGLTSFSHLLNLENLDISRNDINSLQQLACLRHLRELKAEGNKIASIEGLEHMDGLVKLSLQDNRLQSADLTQCRWTRLEMLNMSKNRLGSIFGLEILPSLVALNLDNNQLGELNIESPMPRLRILRVSGNRLQQLRVGSTMNLRTLYVDNNSLSTVIDLSRLTRLENLSLRNQTGRGFQLNTRDIRDIKRLYLSGNPLKTKFLEEPCYNLIYLELAACRLTALPEEMSSLVPNLRVLNLNYNFLEDARPLEGLTRLRKLTIIGSRLKGTKPLIRLLQRMPDVEMLDLRMNPCTLGWYLPLLVRDVPGALQPSEGRTKEKEVAGQTWQDLDAKFRRDLPDESYIGRLAYRGLIMRACTRIRMLDGIEVSEKERAKAHHLLVGIMNKGKKMKGQGAKEGQQ